MYPPAAELDPADKAKINDDLEKLRSCFEELPQTERSIFRMRYSGMGFREIAEALGMPLSSCSVKYYRALPHLLTRMNGGGQ